MPIVKKNNSVQLDPYQKWIIETWIDPLLPNLIGVVTRGHVDPQGQLDVIAMYADRLGIRTYPEFSRDDVYGMCDVDINGTQVHTYGWVRTWGEELHRGIIINPPLAAVVPYNYVNKDGVNKKGQLMQASAHIKRMPTEEEIKEKKFPPCPMDFSAKFFNLKDVKRERVILQDIKHTEALLHQAKLNGAPIRNIVVEHNNGCVHVDLEKQV